MKLNPVIFFYLQRGGIGCALLDSDLMEIKSGKIKVSKGGVYVAICSMERRELSDVMGKGFAIKGLKLVGELVYDEEDLDPTELFTAELSEISDEYFIFERSNKK